MLYKTQYPLFQQLEINKKKFQKTAIAIKKILL